MTTEELQAAFDKLDTSVEYTFIHTDRYTFVFPYDIKDRHDLNSEYLNSTGHMIADIEAIAKFEKIIKENEKRICKLKDEFYCSQEEISELSEHVKALVVAKQRSMNKRAHKCYIKMRHAYVELFKLCSYHIKLPTTHIFYPIGNPLGVKKLKYIEEFTF